MLLFATSSNSRVGSRDQYQQHSNWDNRGDILPLWLSQSYGAPVRLLPSGQKHLAFSVWTLLGRHHDVRILGRRGRGDGQHRTMESEDTRQFRVRAIKIARPCRCDPFSAGGHPVVLSGECLWIHGGLVGGRAEEQDVPHVLRFVLSSYILATWYRQGTICISGSAVLGLNSTPSWSTTIEPTCAHSSSLLVRPQLSGHPPAQ